MRQSKRGAAKVAGFCLLTLALAVGGSNATTLTGMTVTSQADVTRIHVLLNQPVEFSHFMLNDPPRLYVDCRGVDAVLPKKLPGGDGRAGKIEASVWKGEGYHALTRLTVALARPSHAEVKKVEDGIIIELGPVQGGEWTQSSPETTPAESSSTAGGSTSKTDTHTTSTAESTHVPSEMPVTPTKPESTSIKPAPLPVPPEGTPVKGTETSDATPESTHSDTPTTAGNQKPMGPEPAPTTTSMTMTGTKNPTLNPPATETIPTSSPATTTTSPTSSSTTASSTKSATSSTSTPSTTTSTPSTTTSTPSTTTSTPSTTTSSSTSAGSSKTSTPSTTASTSTPTAKMVGPEPAPATLSTKSTPAPKTDLTPAETMNPPATTTTAPSSGTKASGTPSSLTQDEEDAPETTNPAPAGNNNTYRAQEPAASYSKVRRPAIKEIAQSDEGGLAARGGARVSLDIQGADIYTVLRSISEYSGVNIVMGYDVANSVKNAVSFHLENVPWGEALEMVLRSAHLWYREEGNIIRVDTEENLRNEELARSNAARQLEDVMPLTTRIIEVVYANAAEIKPTIEKSLSKRGVVEVDERTNSLVVTDIRSRVEAAVEMIQHLDSQTPQVEIVAKLVDVDARFERDLGVIWNVGGVHADGASLEGDFGANDVVDPTAQVRFGLVRSWGTVSAVLSALERDNKADIISNPRITTVNNREARILVGKKIPLIVLDEAGNPVTELTTIGITLRVTPHINDQNRITLDMHPEVSDLSSQATVQGGVIINTSEADTRVMVGNGETAVIGGLIRSNDEKLKRGVPILKDVPILGVFFSSTTDVREKRELLIFVTPRIVTSFQSQEGGGE